MGLKLLKPVFLALEGYTASQKLRRWHFLIRLFFVSVFTFTLTCFFYFREIRVCHLELNSISNKHIFAEVGFEFPDIQATRLLKDQGLRELGKVYYIDLQNILDVFKETQRHLITKAHWRTMLPNSSFEQLQWANEVICDLLTRLKFSDSRTTTKLHRFGLATDEIIVYNPHSLKAELPNEIWDQISKIVFTTLTSETKYIIDQYRNHPLMLIEDLSIENSLRELTKESIPLKMTKVEPGSRLINPGEQVTPRHIAMLKGMQKALSEHHGLKGPSAFVGSLLLSLTLTLIGIAYFKTLYPKIIKSFPKSILILTVLLMALFLSRTTECILINRSNVGLCPYPIFTLFIALTLTVLINKGVAMLSVGLGTILLTLTSSWNYHHFMIMNFAAACATVAMIKNIRTRIDIFKVCGSVWLIVIPLIISLHLIDHNPWNIDLLIHISTNFLSIALTGGLVVILLPLLESIFSITTDMALMEAVNQGHPLLRRLSTEAIGTYQHSLAVAILAEESALAINANGLLCRAAALYHDIGKLSHPDYFMENQLTGLNRHESLTPVESAELIISHVNEGVKLAQSYQLPSLIIDIIREHHGTTLLSYFYQIEKNNLGNDIPIDDKKFRYKGPVPRSRESGIIMIADSLEAAFRSIDSQDENSICQLTDSVVMKKLEEHQLDLSRLTLNDIEAIKKTLNRTLVASSHKRMKHPNMEKLACKAPTIY